MKKIIFIIIVFAVIYICNVKIYGASLDDYDLWRLNGYVDDEYYDADFTTIVNDIYSSEGDYRNITDGFISIFAGEIKSSVKMLMLVIIIVIMGAVFKSMTQVLKDNSVAKTCNLLVYISSMTILFMVYEEGYKIVVSTIQKVMDFLYVLNPIFFGAVTFAGGSTGGTVLYNFTGLFISAMHIILANILLPAGNYYVIMTIVNNATGDKSFNTMCDLIRRIILYINKAMVCIMIGMTTVKSMVVPLTDTLKNKILKRTISFIPGVGQGSEGIMEIVTGTGNLIKNTIGTAGMLVIVMIIAIPFIKLMALNLMFRFAAAVTEPVAENNIINGINSVCDGIGIICTILCTSCLALIISFGIICVLTGRQI